MRGHDPIIDLRLRRLAPTMVFIELVPALTQSSIDWPRWSRFPVVEVPDGESIRRLDLRFLSGLLVCASGKDPARLQALHDACVAHGAKRVVSVAHDAADEFSPTLAIFDSLATTETAHG